MSSLVLLLVVLALALLLEDWFVTRRRGESVIRRYRERRPLAQRIRRGLRVVLVPAPAARAPSPAAAASFKGKT